LLEVHAALYRYARALSHDPSVAEELVQEAYHRALSARKHPDPPTQENLRPWLFTILRNHWYNELRQRKHDALIEELRAAEAPVTETPENVFSRRFLQSEVRDAVDALPELYREIIVLREIEDLSYSEIARLLDCPAGTVMSRLARARALLRSTLTRIAPQQKKRLSSP
jgi:RNA polymerase sigma-70 factor, ECF subfamily